MIKFCFFFSFTNEDVSSIPHLELFVKAHEVTSVILSWLRKKIGKFKKTIGHLG